MLLPPLYRQRRSHSTARSTGAQQAAHSTQQSISKTGGYESGQCSMWLSRRRCGIRIPSSGVSAESGAAAAPRHALWGAAFLLPPQVRALAQKLCIIVCHGRAQQRAARPARRFGAASKAHTYTHTAQHATHANTPHHTATTTPTMHLNPLQVPPPASSQLPLCHSPATYLSRDTPSPSSLACAGSS